MSVHVLIVSVQIRLKFIHSFLGIIWLQKQCPVIPPAIYSVSNLVMDVTKSLPSILDGEFRMNIDFDSSYADHIGYLHLDVNLKS